VSETEAGWASGPGPTWPPTGRILAVPGSHTAHEVLASYSPTVRQLFSIFRFHLANFLAAAGWAGVSQPPPARRKFCCVRVKPQPVPTVTRNPQCRVVSPVVAEITRSAVVPKAWDPPCCSKPFSTINTVEKAHVLRQLVVCFMRTRPWQLIVRSREHDKSRVSNSALVLRKLLSPRRQNTKSYQVRAPHPESPLVKLANHRSYLQ